MMADFNPPVQISMALDLSSYLDFRPRYLRHDAHGLL